MPLSELLSVAVVGTGVIGRSWAQVFARGGCCTNLFDSDPSQLKKALDWIQTDLRLDCEDGLITESEAQARIQRLVVHPDLGSALRDVTYVQECAPERLDAKKAVFRLLDQAAPAGVPLGSSTSGLKMTEIVAGLEGAARCVVAHPVNPPHVIPIVEIVPGKLTNSAVVTRVRDFMISVGQIPVVLKKEVPGFLLNRLQAAVFRESIHLVESGVAELADIEAVMSEGLGVRWALLGPFGVGDSNTDGGLRQNFSVYRQTFLDLMNALGPVSSLTSAIVDRLSADMDVLNRSADRASIRRWRDRMVRKIRALKVEDPRP